MNSSLPSQLFSKVLSKYAS